MNNSKISSYVGLAQRAGKVLYGEDIIVEKLEKCGVVLIDDGATATYKERLIKKCNGVPVFTVEDLKSAVHREQVLAIGVTNAELAGAIIDQLR